MVAWNFGVLFLKQKPEKTEPTCDVENGNVRLLDIQRFDWLNETRFSAHNPAPLAGKIRFGDQLTEATSDYTCQECYIQ